MNEPAIHVLPATDPVERLLNDHLDRQAASLDVGPLLERIW